jgi:hypothetical protein
MGTRCADLITLYVVSYTVRLPIKFLRLPFKNLLPSIRRSFPAFPFLKPWLELELPHGFDGGGFGTHGFGAGGLGLGGLGLGG